MIYPNMDKSDVKAEAIRLFDSLSKEAKSFDDLSFVLIKGMRDLNSLIEEGEMHGINVIGDHDYDRLYSFVQAIDSIVHKNPDVSFPKLRDFLDSYCGVKNP